jgi:hypothetical protein
MCADAAATMRQMLEVVREVDLFLNQHETTVTGMRYALAKLEVSDENV